MNQVVMANAVVALQNSIYSRWNELEAIEQRFNHICDNTWEFPSLADPVIEYEMNSLREDSFFISTSIKELEEMLFQKKVILDTLAKRYPHKKRWIRKNNCERTRKTTFEHIEEEKEDIRKKRFAKEDILLEVQLFHEAKIEEEERLELEEYDYECAHATHHGFMELIEYMEDEEELDYLIERISMGEVELEDRARNLATRYLAEKRVDEAVRHGYAQARCDAIDHMDDILEDEYPWWEIPHDYINCQSDEEEKDGDDSSSEDNEMLNDEEGDNEEEPSIIPPFLVQSRRRRIRFI